MKIFEAAGDEKAKGDIANELYLNYNPPQNVPCNFVGKEECKFIPFQEALQKIKKSQRWQSFNISKNKALKNLERYSREMEDYKKKWLEEYEKWLGGK